MVSDYIKKMTNKELLKPVLEDIRTGLEGGANEWDDDAWDALEELVTEAHRRLNAHIELTTQERKAALLDELVSMGCIDLADCGDMGKGLY